MKNSTIVSAIVRWSIFAVPYLGLSIGLLPSLVIGASAFGAGELILSKNRENKTRKIKYI